MTEASETSKGTGKFRPVLPGPLYGLTRSVDAVATASAIAAALVFFAVGILMGIEVVLRSAGHPTKWTAEVAQIAQIWCVFMASAYVLAKGHMISVDILPIPAGSRRALAVDVIALVGVAGVALVLVTQGIHDVTRTLQLSTRTDTALTLPMWVLQLSMPIGLGLLVLQCWVELLKLGYRDPRPAPPSALKD